MSWGGGGNSGLGGGGGGGSEVWNDMGGAGGLVGGGGGNGLVLPEVPELGIGMAARSASICRCTILSDSCSTKALNLDTSTPRKNG